MKNVHPKLFASAVLLAAACGGSQNGGKVSVKLTDAPGNFKAAVVTISEIDLVGSAGVTVLSNTAVTTDLLKLSNATADLVQDATVQPGTYTELRFKISGGYLEVAQAGGGSIIYASSADYAGLPAGAQVGGSLQMPSLAQSGLKVDLPDGNVAVGTDSKILLVDFNVEQSFGQAAGNSGQWVMHPVLKATDFTLSGTVDVGVALAAGAALPPALTLSSFDAVLTIANGDGTSSTKTLALAADGTAEFKFLAPGSNYSLGLQQNAGAAVSFTTSPATPLPVTVTSGQVTNAKFSLSTP